MPGLKRTGSDSMEPYAQTVKKHFLYKAELPGMQYMHRPEALFLTVFQSLADKRGNQNMHSIGSSSPISKNGLFFRPDQKKIQAVLFYTDYTLASRIWRNASSAI